MAGNSNGSEVADMGDEMDERWGEAYRRKLRKKLRETLLDTQKRREEITIPEELLKQLKKSDKLFPGIVSSREAALDSENIRVISEIAREQVETTTAEVINFDSVAFAEKLVTRMGGRRAGEQSNLTRLDWMGLGMSARRAFKTAPSPSFLYGALEVQPIRKRERAAQRRRAGEGSGEATRPKELTNFEEETESTTKDVARILEYVKRACSKDGRVHYFTFLVDPDPNNGFSHTVENMFHFSFLVKEGRAGIEMGEDGQPYIHLPKEVNKSNQSTKQTKNQVIISLGMEEWQRAIQKFNIQESYIPQREQL